MSTITPTMTECTTFAPIAHPAWCDLTECTVETKDGQVVSVSHRSANFTWEGDGLSALMVTHRDDGSTGDPQLNYSTHPYLYVDGEGDCAVEDIESLGAWLLARAAEMRLSIAQEGIPTQRTA